MTKRPYIHAFALILLVGVGVLSVIFFPVVKGRYQFNRFVSALQVGMSRHEVRIKADAIGYDRHDVEVPGKGIVPSENGIPLGSFVDVYYFKNVMLHSVVEVEYDSTGRVVKVLNDQ